MHHREEVISRSDLVEHIYAQDLDRDSNTVEVFIARLRKKLPPGLIETVRGLGYRLTAPVDAPSDGEVHRYRLSGPAGTMLGIIERSVRLDDRPEVAAREFRLIVATDERLMVEPAARVNGALWLALGVLLAGPRRPRHRPGHRRAGAGVRRAFTTTHAARRPRSGAQWRCAASRR